MANPHTLTVGVSRYGKTRLQREVARVLHARGLPIMVLDAYGDRSDWPCDYFTNDPQEFVRIARQVQQQQIFVDEGAETVGRYDAEMNWLTTGSANPKWGHSTHLICQCVAQLSPIMRKNCQSLYLFRSDEADVDLMVRQFADKRLYQATEFDVGEFFYCVSAKPLMRGYIDVATAQVRYWPATSKGKIR